MEQSYTDFQKVKLYLDPLSVLLLIGHETDKIKSGLKEIRACCPISKSNNPTSFCINPQTHIFHCKSCNATGDLIELYALSLGIAKPKAAQELANHFQSNDSQNIHALSLKLLNPDQRTDIDSDEAVNQAWDEAQEGTGHSYLEAKKITPCLGLRYGPDQQGNHSIVVPLSSIETGDLKAIQYVHQGGKYFLTGSKTKGAAFSIGDPVKAKKLYVAEGLATTITLWMAIDQEHHESAFLSCGSVNNSSKNVQLLRLKYPNTEIIVCLDKDKAGSKTSETIKKDLQSETNIKFYEPDFTGLETKDGPTDFNDLYQLTGSLEIVRKQVQNQINSAIPTLIQPLVSTINHESPDEHPLSYILKNNSEEELIKELQNLSPGTPTGFKIGEIDLDFPGGAISIIAAPTSHGKTSALINFSLGALQQDPELYIYFFTYEEAAHSIQVSFLNTWMNEEITNGNNKRSMQEYLKDGKCEYIRKEKLDLFKDKKKTFFTNYFDSGRIKVIQANKDDRPEMTINNLVEAIALIKKQHSKILICIDYIQLIKSAQPSRAGRQEEVKEICLMLKDCAIETGLPIVVAAQFNRTVVTEADLNPLAIGEAGDIERIASIVIGMFNRKFHYTSDGNKDRNGNPIPIESTIYFEILKGRDIGNGYNSVMDFDGNKGKLTQKPQVLSSFATMTLKSNKQRDVYNENKYQTRA